MEKRWKKGSEKPRAKAVWGRRKGRLEAQEAALD